MKLAKLGVAMAAALALCGQTAAAADDYLCIPDKRTAVSQGEGGQMSTLPITDSDKLVLRGGVKAKDSDTEIFVLSQAVNQQPKATCVQSAANPKAAVLIQCRWTAGRFLMDRSKLEFFVIEDVMTGVGRSQTSVSVGRCSRLN